MITYESTYFMARLKTWFVLSFTGKDCKVFECLVLWEIKPLVRVKRRLQVPSFFSHTLGRTNCVSLLLDST